MNPHTKGFLAGSLITVVFSLFLALFIPIGFGIPESNHEGTYPAPFHIRVKSTDDGYKYDGLNNFLLTKEEAKARICRIQEAIPDAIFTISYMNSMSRYEVLLLPHQLQIPWDKVNFIHEEEFPVYPPHGCE